MIGPLRVAIRAAAILAGVLALRLRIVSPGTALAIARAGR